MSDELDPFSKSMVHRFLAVTRFVPITEMKERTGVSRETVRRWRNEFPTRVTAQVLQSVAGYLDFVEEHGEDAKRIGSRSSSRYHGPNIDGLIPIPDDVWEILQEVPVGMSRRFADRDSIRARVGQAYAYGVEKEWPKEKLDVIDDYRRWLDTL